MKKNLFHILGPLCGLLLFAVVLWVLHHQLSAYHYQDVVRHLADIPLHSLLLAFLLTVLNYVVLTGYDALAVRYIQHPLAYSRIALTSFISYAFSHNIGLSVLSGGSVRYRLYSVWGLSTVEIAQVIVFGGVTFLLGFFTIGGAVFLLTPPEIPSSLHLSFASVRPLGVILLLLLMGYLLWVLARKAPLSIRDWEFALPSPQVAVAQIVLSSCDWALAGSVLYVLLPPQTTLSYPEFLGVFLLAQIAGIVSQIPGGLGVVETVVLLFLSSTVPAPAVLGSLFAYRGLYYILPLIVAAVLLGTSEIFHKKEEVKQLARTVGRWVPVLVPHVLAFTTFLCGAILLLSGATPAVGSRLHWLKDFFPLPVIEVSHFLGSLVGMGLLLLARGLQRRLDVAYFLTLAFLAGGIGFSLLKGFDYEEAIILTVMFGALLPCRQHFYRQASLLNEQLSLGWIAAIIAVLLASAWLGLFSYRHVAYANDLWWHFSLFGNASRFLRAMVGAASIATVFVLARFLRPAPAEPTIPGQADVDKARAIIAQSKNISANLALLGDKKLLFSNHENAFIMYGIEGRSWIVLGDPVGSESEMNELAWQFRELCDRHGGWTVFYQVSQEYLPLYLDLGLTVLKLGEEGRVRLETFSLQGEAGRRFRHTINHIEKEGGTFTVIPSDQVPSLLPEFKAISDAWLAEKHTKEKGFSLGFFHPTYLQQFPAGIVQKHGKIVAFANLWLGAEKEVLSPDLMRYHPEAPASVMEYLFLQLILWGKQEGYRWFNVGMAPLSGLNNRALAPLWNRVGAFVFHHGEHFYNFQGLRQYKEKFSPEWEPKYLASPGGLALPRILTNLASLISGGLKGIVTK